MSIVERLFPASELEALRATPYDFDLAPTPKRRKLSGSPCEIIPGTRRSSSDSGYESDDSSALPKSSLSASSRKRSHSSISTSSSQATSPAPAPAPAQNYLTQSQSALFHKYLASLPSTDPNKYRLRTQSDPSRLKDFYHQITIARSRQRTSISGLPTPPCSNGGTTHSSPTNIKTENSDDEAQIPSRSHSCVHDVGQGWTAGPKSALDAHLSARIFDGIRITSDERSMLNSLIPEGLPPNTLLTNGSSSAIGRQMPTFAYPQPQRQMMKTEMPKRSSFAGIAIPIGAYDDDDDEDFTNANEGDVDVDGYDLELDGEGTGKVEDFFNIEEACDDSLSAGDVKDEL